jgi:hypothetical protein
VLLQKGDIVVSEYISSLASFHHLIDHFFPAPSKKKIIKKQKKKQNKGKPKSKKKELP